MTEGLFTCESVCSIEKKANDEPRILYFFSLLKTLQLEHVEKALLFRNVAPE